MPDGVAIDRTTRSYTDFAFAPQTHELLPAISEPRGRAQGTMTQGTPTTIDPREFAIPCPIVGTLNNSHREVGGMAVGANGCPIYYCYARCALA